MPEALNAGEILTIRQLAEYLMVSDKTVYRMLDRNQIPAVRVGAQWRFRRHDIDAWLTDEVRRVEHEGQRAVLDALESSELAIHPMLTPENVWLAVAPGSRDDLLALMVREASLDAHVDRDQLYRSIREREELCSTALLTDAAFPHPIDPRPFRFSRKRVLLAVMREPLDFRDVHDHRPRIVAMILARSTQGHLLAVSRAIKLFASETLVARLLSARSAGEAIEAITAEEARIKSEARTREGR